MWPGCRIPWTRRSPGSPRRLERPSPEWSIGDRRSSSDVHVRTRPRSADLSACAHHPRGMSVPSRTSPKPAWTASCRGSRSSGCRPCAPTARPTSSRSGSPGTARRCSCSRSREPRRCATCAPTRSRCWPSASRRTTSTWPRRGPVELLDEPAPNCPTAHLAKYASGWRRSGCRPRSSSRPTRR